jgi:beta-glucosidase
VACQACAGSAVYDGHVTAPKTGDYQLALTGFGDATLSIDGQQIATMNGADERRAYGASPTLHWAQGSTHTIHITFQANHPFDTLNPGTLLLEWKPPAGANSPAIQRAVAAARQSDVAIVYANTIEGEARDRVSLHLPEGDDQLIRAVSAANPHTIVVLATSGPVTMPWLNRVDAVVQTYFGGQEQGAALAHVLWGDVNPSGKLTITYPTSDTAVPAGITSPWDTATDLNVNYREGINVGYKGYDTEGITPLFPFGHGLSYTTFEYSRLRVRRVIPAQSLAHSLIRVRFRIANTGGPAGDEVAQVYLGLPASTGEPPKRLVGWARVGTTAGRATSVEVTIDPNAPTHPLGYFDTGSNSWKIAPGTYTIYVGSSERDTPLSATFTIT